MPPGRFPPRTQILLGAKGRDGAYKALRRRLAQGERAYVVCPMVEAPEEETGRDYANACDLAVELAEKYPNISVSLVHGRMSSEERDAAMAAFRSGESQVLVATTVIEVGVDVPNANFMVIDNAERLGLTQLHQLRGRVGRGKAQSYCLLLYQPPLGPLSKQRLAVLRDSQDGFYIAEQDLAIRGPGDILGERQSGDIAFKIADLARDDDLLPIANRLANQIASRSEETTQALMKRWIGVVERYQQA